MAGVDQVFREKQDKSRDFTFDSTVAGVFDDMVERSVPFYSEIQRMVGELSRDFAQENTAVYDLGCSTGTSLALLHPLLPPSVSLVGIDNSEAMLDEARQKLAPIAETRRLSLQYGQIEDLAPPENASVVLMLLTLQFVRPLQREKIIQRIHQGLQPQGVLIVVEKLLCADSRLNRLYIEHYYDYKRRQGYSEMEISQKREALENVLVPYRPEENVALMRGAGFAHVEDFFRWYNFNGFIAVKA